MIVIGYIGWAFYLCLALNYMLGILGHMIYRKGTEASYNYRLGNFIGFKGMEDRGRGIENCMICRQKFTANDDMVQLMCGDDHVFHNNCIVKNIDREPYCPICRTRIETHRA